MKLLFNTKCVFLFLSYRADKKALLIRKLGVTKKNFRPCRHRITDELIEQSESSLSNTVQVRPVIDGVRITCDPTITYRIKVV